MAIGNLPGDTPVTKMGLSEQEIEILSPRARKLTKEQLVNLGRFTRTHHELTENSLLEKFDAEYNLDLSVEDVHSLYDAFHDSDQRRLSGAPLEVAGACCCCTCTPCCSCTASVVTQPVRLGDNGLQLR